MEGAVKGSSQDRYNNNIWKTFGQVHGFERCRLIRAKWNLVEKGHLGQHGQVGWTGLFPCCMTHDYGHWAEGPISLLYDYYFLISFLVFSTCSFCLDFYDLYIENAKFIIGQGYFSQETFKAHCLSCCHCATNMSASYYLVNGGSSWLRGGTFYQNLWLGGAFQWYFVVR